MIVDKRVIVILSFNRAYAFFFGMISVFDKIC